MYGTAHTWSRIYMEPHMHIYGTAYRRADVQPANEARTRAMLRL
jgi:hypothetical protein